MGPSGRCLLGAIAFVAVVSNSNASPQVGALPDLPNAVTLVETVLRQPPFGIALDEWLTRHPAATCRRLDPWEQKTRSEPPFQWCALCTEQLGSQTTEYGFYPLRDDLPIACRLEHLRAYADGPPATVQRIHQQTVDLITRQRGAGLRPILTVPLPGGGWQDVGDTLEDFGTPSWRDVYQWRPGAEDAYAYIYEDTHRKLPARAAISIADPQLKARLLDENRRTYRPEYSIKKLADALRETAPSISEALSGGQGSNLRSALLEALEKARNAPEAQKPAFLLAADWLVGAYVDTLPAHLEANSALLRPLVQAGVGLENFGVEGTLRRTPNLLRLAVERYSGTPWGERAFVDLLKRSDDCADGDPDPFRRVIEEGTRWLSTRPQSPYRAEVMFAVAESFETWWSFANAVADSLVNRADYVDGSEIARQRAIEWYQRAAALIPATDGAFAARRKVVRLSLKLDTGQRAYSCHGGG